MVGNDVHNKSHVMFKKLRAEYSKLALAPEFRVDLVMVADIVSMRASRAGQHDRRYVKIADSQIVKIGDQSSCIFKRESVVELQPVGGARNATSCADILN